MTPVIGIVIFLVLFAVLMVAVGLGSRFLELRGKKQMETILNPTTGQVQEVETSILVAPINRDPLDAFLERSQLQGSITTLLQQAGLQWAPSHLLVAMAVGAVVGGVFARCAGAVRARSVVVCGQWRAGDRAVDRTDSAAARA